MTAPYTQANYADWKSRIPQGSAIERLLAQMNGGGQSPMTPPFNPNAPSPQGILNVPRDTPPPMAQGLLPLPPAQAEAPQEQAPPDDAHEHKGGLLGWARHAIGADRMAPELAALLTPEQEARAKPGLLRSVVGAVLERKGPQAIQQDRAMNMLGLEDAKKGRDTRAAVEAQRPQILAAMGPMPEEPQAREEWLARGAQMAATAPLPDKEFAEQLRLTVNQTRERMVQPLANKVIRDVKGPDGRTYIVTQGPDGRELSRQEQSIRAPRVTWTTRAQPDAEGYIIQQSSDGQIRRTGFKMLPGVAGQRQVAGMMQRENQLRTVSEDADNVQAALDEVAGNPDAFGAINFLPNAIVQRNPLRSQEALDADAYSVGTVEYVVGRLRHDRFGAALTQGEAARALRVFSEPTSTPGAIRSQLVVIQRAVERQQQRLEAQLAQPTPEAGSDTPAPTTRTTRARPAGVSDADWTAFLASKGERP